MHNSDHQICPWCDSEIVWDPEIGPEETCPHCLNELSDYRSLDVSIAKQGGAVSHPDYEDDGETGGTDFADEFDPDADDRLDDLYGYERSVEYVLERQDEVCECDRCREDMLYVGMQTTMPEHFKSVSPAGAGGPLLQAPFRYSTFVCPSCFRLQFVLGDDERIRLVSELRKLNT